MRNIVVVDAPSNLGLRPAQRADVLDPAVVPAVDGPEDDGLLPDQLGPLLLAFVRAPRCVGLDVTVYGPDLDPDGTAGALPTDPIVAAFAED